MLLNAAFFAECLILLEENKCFQKYGFEVMFPPVILLMSLVLIAFLVCTPALCVCSHHWLPDLACCSMQHR